MPNNLVLPNQSNSRVSSTTGVSTTSLSAAHFSSPVALTILSASSLFRVIAAFLSFYFLKSNISLPIYLFFVTLGASSLLICMQRPWNGRRLTPKRIRKVMVTGVLLSCTLFLWTAGLQSAGPLRTLLIDGAELPLLYIFAVVSRRELPEKGKTRGCVLMMIAYALIIWDASGKAPNIKEIEQTKFGHTAELTFAHLKEKTAEEMEQLKSFTKSSKVGEHKDVDVDDDMMPGKGIPAPARRRRLLSMGLDRGSSGSAAQDVLSNGPALRSEANDDGKTGRKVPALIRRFLFFDPGQQSIGPDRQDVFMDETVPRFDAGSGGGMKPGKDSAARRRRLLSSDPQRKSSGSVIRDVLSDGTAIRSEVGVIFVLLASILMQTSRGYTRRLATELGGSKRQFALTVSASSLSILPFALISSFSRRAAAFLSLSRTDVSNSVHIFSVCGYALIGILWLTLPYYFRSLVSTTLKQKTLLQAGVVGPFVLAALASLVGYGERAGGLSWILVVSFGLVVLGLTIMLEGSGIRRSLSELPVESRSVNGSRASNRK